MNQELRAAHLLSEGPTLAGELDKTSEGFLGPVFCQRKPLRRIAWLNAEPSCKHGFELSSLTLGKMTQPTVDCWPPRGLLPTARATGTEAAFSTGV
jgi:hypothetical protein